MPSENISSNCCNITSLISTSVSCSLFQIVFVDSLYACWMSWQVVAALEWFCHTTIGISLSLSFPPCHLPNFGQGAGSLWMKHFLKCFVRTPQHTDHRRKAWCYCSSRASHLITHAKMFDWEEWAKLNTCDTAIVIKVDFRRMIPVPLSHIHRIRSSPQLDHAQHAHQSQGSQQAKRLPLIRVSISRSATTNSNQDPIQTDQTWAMMTNFPLLGLRLWLKGPIDQLYTTTFSMSRCECGRPGFKVW